jgi:DNA invertase Pin-like site-specific DNA recombinase
MQQRVEQLGWPTSQIQVLGGDTGTSGSSQYGREDYQVLLEAVLDRTAGMIAAAELSRLARDNQDWGQLIRLCRYHDVLLADEHRVYNAADPQDRVVLGIQGTFNEYEVAIVTARMHACRQQKAERGELYEGFPPGYICRHFPLQEKHPDERVQRAVRKLFDDFDLLPSAYALWRQLVKEEFELPHLPSGNDWRDIEWRSPTYANVLGILQHPSYAGIYVHGRRKTVYEIDGEGHVRRHTCRLPREEWEVFLPQHHEAYISEERWERNVAKISVNQSSRRSPGRGDSVLSGLLRCRRCGKSLRVNYSKGVRYSCRGKKAEPNRRCFSFAGSGLERAVEELIFHAVSPASILLAEHAAELLLTQRSQQRRLVQDRVGAAKEIEARAAREYKATDATYLEVRRKLAAEWDDALQTVHALERKLSAFDATQPTSLTNEERHKLSELAADLERVWYDDRANGVLKKQIVRTLIEEIIVDITEPKNTIHFWVHWSGGHHTEHQIERGQRQRQSQNQKALCEIVETLRKIQSDEQLAATLNRAALTTPTGKTWTAHRVAQFRRQHSIAKFSSAECEQAGWLTQEKCATRCEVSPMSISRLVSAGILPAEQPRPGFPAVIQATDLRRPEVARAINRLKSKKNGPLPADPNQLNLFNPEEFKKP